jgi:cyclopropane-fatty-acyl-phospholipid synthase
MSSIDPMLPEVPVAAATELARLNLPTNQSGRACPEPPAVGRMLLRMLGGLQHGSLRLITPEGASHQFGPGDEPHAELQLHSWRPIVAMMRRGDVAFGQAWIDGQWRTDNLTGLIMIASLNRNVLDAAVFGTWFGRMIDRLRHLILRANTRAGAKRNIAAHYDLGNEFYALWLDETMTYSSACFDGDAQRTLAQGQHAKYAHALERVAAPRGGHLLEIGCGWGGFAEAARLAGHRVTGLTLSREQLAFAQSRLTRAGLADLTDLRLQDYRDASGTFDGIVSIEMFEAVGERWWPAYFQSVARLLSATGRAVVQTITIRDDRFERYRRSIDFIQTHIFPGGMLPSPAVFEREANRAGLRVIERHPFGQDYARTLALWHERFLAILPALPALGFDERFIRMWRFYLSYCEAGFRSGDTDVFQFVLAHR